MRKHIFGKIVYKKFKKGKSNNMKKENVEVTIHLQAAFGGSQRNWTFRNIGEALLAAKLFVEIGKLIPKALLEIKIMSDKNRTIFAECVTYGKSWPSPDVDCLAPNSEIAQVRENYTFVTSPAFAKFKRRSLTVNLLIDLFPISRRERFRKMFIDWLEGTIVQARCLHLWASPHHRIQHGKLLSWFKLTPIASLDRNELTGLFDLEQ